MNKLLSILLVSGTVLSVFGNTSKYNSTAKIKNDLSELQLKGKVKSLTEIVKNQKYTADDLSTCAFLQAHGYKDKTLQELIKKENKKIYFFNEKGYKIEEIDSNSIGGVLYTEYTYKYDYYGNKIEVEWHTPSGSFSSKAIYKYDYYGNNIEEDMYNFSGSLGEKINYKYDDKGNMIESSSTSNAYKKSFKYDDKGNKIEECDNYKSDGSLDSKYTYKYDDKRNLIEDNIYAGNGSLGQNEIYKYDDKGNMIEMEEITYYKDNSSMKSSYKYDYDNTSNWIKRTEIENDISIEITVREIVYY